MSDTPEKQPSIDQKGDAALARSMDDWRERQSQADEAAAAAADRPQ